MNHKKQQENCRPLKNRPEALAALVHALGECRSRPSYDYQRIILCLGAVPGLAAVLAPRPGVRLLDPARPVPSKCNADILVFDRADECPRQTLQSIVRHINRTRGIVVLLLAAPSPARWFARWPLLAAQLRRRTHLTLHFSTSPPPQ